MLPLRSAEGTQARMKRMRRVLVFIAIFLLALVAARGVSAAPHGLIQDLTDLGILQPLPDGRLQMPDVYRVAFGLGRKGGVKPLR